MLVHGTSISGWTDTSRRYGSSARGKIATLSRQAGLTCGRTSPSKPLIKRSRCVWLVRRSPLGHRGGSTPPGTRCGELGILASLAMSQRRPRRYAYLELPPVLRGRARPANPAAGSPPAAPPAAPPPPSADHCRSGRWRPGRSCTGLPGGVGGVGGPLQHRVHNRAGQATPRRVRYRRRGGHRGCPSRASGFSACARRRIPARRVDAGICHPRHPPSGAEHRAHVEQCPHIGGRVTGHGEDVGVEAGASPPFLLPTPQARAATLVAAANASTVLNPRLANRMTPCGSTSCGLRDPTPRVRTAHHADTGPLHPDDVGPALLKSKRIGGRQRRPPGSQASVAPTKAPAAASRSTVSTSSSAPSAVRKVACSTPSTPAATDSAMPRGPCACAVTASPKPRAASHAARSSTGPYCDSCTPKPGVINPPVAMILMMSTPAATRCATAARTPSIPSAAPPRNQQCPPVRVIGGPDISSSGPPVQPLRTRPVR